MKVIVTSELEAWDALERATSGEGFPEEVELVFQGWPSFNLDVKGRDWDSSVPTRVMAPLLDVQKDINRAYTTISYNDPNLRKLKDEDRDELEIVVKVKKGSSVFDADLWKQFSHLAEAAVGRMSGNQIVITVLGMALMTASAVMFKSWLASRQKEKETENQIKLSQLENDRHQILVNAMQASPVLQMARDDNQATNNRLLKAVKPGDSVSMKGVELKSEEVEVLVQPERDRAQDVHIEGIFEVLGNRTDITSGFRIKVKRLSDELILNADVPLELPFEQRELIQKAEWTKGKSKGLVKLWITASMLRDSITQAIVGSAEKYDGESV